MKLLETATIVVGLVMFLSASAQAVEDDYLDDRSSPQTVIASYFNALNRHEFARAWSYWHEGALGSNFEDFVEGLTEVTAVEFRQGKYFGEGAAGSIYYQVPMAIGYEIDSRWQDVYAGCFVLKLTQPALQSPPFNPLHIENASLSLIEDAKLLDIKPGPCAD